MVDLKMFNFQSKLDLNAHIYIIYMINKVDGRI